MRTISTNIFTRGDFWRHLIALAILVLALFSAALDRRNVVYGRDTRETGVVEHQPPALTTDELVQEMMTHD